MPSVSPWMSWYAHKPLRKDIQSENDWTYQISQYVNFVKEHFLLILVHVSLPEDLDGSLRAGVSVDAHSDFAERTYI